MSQETTKPRPVETFTVGDHIRDAYGVHKLVHALPYVNGDGQRAQALTLVPLDSGDPWVAKYTEGTNLTPAGDDEVREYADKGRRVALAEALQRLAGDIVEHRLPLTSFRFTVSPGHLNSQAEVERWAEYLGTRVETSGASADIAVTNSSRPIADGLSFDVRAQGNADPVAEPEQEWLFTFGSGQTYDGRFVRITGTEESARSRMNLVFGHAWCDQYTWASFDAAGLPGRVTELPKAEWPAHADPAGE